MTFSCPVCYYDQLEEPASDYNICDCCGTEFGNDDEQLSWAQLRSNWINKGGPWFYGHPPLYWNPYAQLLRANVPLEILQTIFAAREPFTERIITTEGEYFANAA